MDIYPGHLPVKVLLNPTKAQVVALLESTTGYSLSGGTSHYIRGVTVLGRDLYTWDGFQATHEDIVSKIVTEGRHDISEWDVTVWPGTRYELRILRPGDYDSKTSIIEVAASTLAGH